MSRFAAYATCSTALASGVLLKAVSVRSNFFSACIYLSQSNACVIVLVNFLVLAMATLVFGLQRLLYGPLRPIEAEQLYDKAWFAITETCLAMTIFRDEIGVWFIALFVCLLIGKVWAWIGEGRVEILDQQPPADPHSFHIRLSISLLLSLTLDTYLLNHSIQTVRRQAKPNMMVMFAFEFAVLTTSSLSTAFRYLISLQEAAIIKKRTAQQLRELRARRLRERSESLDTGDVQQSAQDDEVSETDIEIPEWEDKSRWILYLDLFTDFIRLLLYLTFFVMLCIFYGMPLHIIRDVALALRSFHKRFTDFVRYKHATRDMNARYADATAENLRTNDVCIICRETMRPWGNDETTDSQQSRSKLLPCGHVLHLGCLRRWLQWQQSCPTCRQPVLQERVLSQEPDSSINVIDGARVPEAAQTAADQGAQTQAPGPTLSPTPTEQNTREQTHASLPLNSNASRIINSSADTSGLNHTREFIQRTASNPNSQNIPPHQMDQIPQHAGVHSFQGLDTQDIRANESPVYPLIDSLTAPLHLGLIEHQILQLVDNLRAAAAQLTRIRVLQEEAVRTQVQQSNSPQRRFQLYSDMIGERPLLAGSESLPPGLSLPEGWSIVSLNRSDGGTSVSLNDDAFVPTTSEGTPNSTEQSLPSSSARASRENTYQTRLSQAASGYPSRELSAQGQEAEEKPPEDSSNTETNVSNSDLT